MVSDAVALVFLARWVHAVGFLNFDRDAVKKIQLLNNKSTFGSWSLHRILFRSLRGTLTVTMYTIQGIKHPFPLQAGGAGHHQDLQSSEGQQAADQHQGSHSIVHGHPYISTYLSIFSFWMTANTVVNQCFSFLQIISLYLYINFLKFMCYMPSYRKE